MRAKLMSLIEKHPVWFSLVPIIILAMVVRIFFGGDFMGSDDWKYTKYAAQIARGEWPDFIRSLPTTPADRLEAIYQHRLGLLLPSAALLAIFPQSEFVPRIWPIFTSIGIVLAVFGIGYRVGGVRMAAVASLLIALGPIDLYVTRAMVADAPLGLALALCLYFLVKFSDSQSTRDAFLSGVFMGLAIWVKNQSVITFPIAALIILLCLRSWRGLAAYVLGFTVPVAVFLLIFAIIGGDPLIPLIVTGQRGKDAVSGALVAIYDQATASPFFYFQQLLRDVRNTWLLGIFAAGGFGYYLYNLIKRRCRVGETVIVLFALSFVVVLSFFPASISPYKAITKWAYYMVMFTFSLALVAAIWMSKLPPLILTVLLTVYGFGGLTIIMIQNVTEMDHMANSRAILNITANKKYHDEVCVVDHRTWIYKGYLDDLGVKFEGGCNVVDLSKLDGAIASTSQSKLYLFLNHQNVSRRNLDQSAKEQDVRSWQGCVEELRVIKESPPTSIARRFSDAVLDTTGAIAKLNIPMAGWLDSVFRKSFIGESQSFDDFMILTLNKSQCRLGKASAGL